MNWGGLVERALRRMDREAVFVLEHEVCPDDFVINRHGAILRIRLPTAERIRKGWEEWSAYGTTY